MHRTNIEFTDKQITSLRKIAEEDGLSIAGVLRKSLALLSLVRREAKSGTSICVCKDGKILKEIIGIVE